MPTIEENRRAWDSTHWAENEKTWSRPWGGPDYQWYGSLFPRVMGFLPTGTIVEIATGHGRWSQYLLRYCDRFIGIDLVESCAEGCRERFAHETHATFHSNDGTSLEAVPDEEADFIFSFDSLVHAEMDVVHGYVLQMASKLSPDGVAFIHHSNMAGVVSDIPEYFRAPSVSAKQVADACEEFGLACVGQELITWGGKALIDCMTLIARPGSRYARPNRVQEGVSFWHAASPLKDVAELYGRASFS